MRTIISLWAENSRNLIKKILSRNFNLIITFVFNKLCIFFSFIYIEIVQVLRNRQKLSNSLLGKFGTMFNMKIGLNFASLLGGKSRIFKRTYAVFELKIGMETIVTAFFFISSFLSTQKW